MTIQVFVADEQSDRPVDPGRWQRLAERVLADRGVAGTAELSVLFVDEAAIASLNERFLSRPGPTDVLSFPIEDEIDLPGPPQPGREPDLTGPGREPFGEDDPAPLLLGDVVICPAVAWRNAPEHAGSYEDELALLLVHGILHLLGMDHEQDADAAEMEQLERELLARHHHRPPAEGADR
ncbi:MAG TPA: rRNA maturation RNase YbeY [Acidimicrobiales bacterium]|nr:rRNA maturation RNase YbeY [Acidimicrobiales bacterium]